MLLPRGLRAVIDDMIVGTTDVGLITEADLQQCKRCKTDLTLCGPF